jgi:hypothetical protein
MCRHVCRCHLTRSPGFETTTSVESGLSAASMALAILLLSEKRRVCEGPLLSKMVQADASSADFANCWRMVSFSLLKRPAES